MTRTATRHGEPTFAEWSRQLREYRQALAHAIRVARAELADRRRRMLQEHFRTNIREEAATAVGGQFDFSLLAHKRGFALPVAPGQRARFVEAYGVMNRYSAERLYSLPCGADDALGDVMRWRSTAARYLSLYCHTR